jgi:hypothetical protein
MEEGVLQIHPDLLGWRYFISLSCTEGRLWDEEYCGSGVLELGNDIDRAVELMRQNKLKAGECLLQECRACMRKKEGSISSSIFRVFDRWYLGARAYYFYVVGEHSLARESLELADEAIGDAISLCPFLLVLARSCPELCLNCARTFRNQRRWREMRATIDRGWDMIEDRAPLCRLRNGSAISMKDIDGFYRSISPRDHAEEKALALLLDPQFRRRNFDGLVRKAAYVPYIVVPWY